MNRSVLSDVFVVLALLWLLESAPGAIGSTTGKQSGIKILEQDGQDLVLDGEKPNAWGYMTFADGGMQNIEIKGTFKILYPAKTYNPPMFYWPLNYHYLADEPGYDFGIVVRDQNKGAFYRIQFSVQWDEVSLWKEGAPGTDPEAPSIPSGFFAVVKAKAGINISSTYAFSVKAIGNKIELAMNGKQVLTFEDKLLPIEKGGWGLGVFNGARVQVSGLESGKAEGTITLPAKKRPDFRLQNWHGNSVVFDGDEPIARLTQGTAAWMNDVKLKSGYRAQLAWPFIFDRKFRSSAWEGEKAICTNDTVVASVVSFGKANECFDGKSTMTLGYDAKNDLYYYDMDVSMSLKVDAAVSGIFDRNAVYYANTYPYNPMPTSDPSIKVNHQHWCTASSPYRTALVKLADGYVYRWPIHHYYGAFVKPEFPGDGGWMLWNKVRIARDAYIIMYPEKVVCPMVEIVSPQGDGDHETALDSCCAYWDMHYWHTSVKDGKRGIADYNVEFKAGETFHERFRIKGMPAAEADKMSAESKLLPCFDPAKERPFYVDGVNAFDKGGNVEETAGAQIWTGGGKWDKSTGRNDKYSIRLEDEAGINTYIGYNGSSAKSKKARLSVWVKAEKGWTGAGIRFGVKGCGDSFGGDWQWSEYFVPGEEEWRQFFYDIPLPTYYLINLELKATGKGNLWIDDLEYNILEK